MAGTVEGETKKDLMSVSEDLARDIRKIFKL